MTHPIEQYSPTIHGTAPVVPPTYNEKPIRCRWPGHGLPKKEKKG